MPRAAARDNWPKTVEQIAALGPAIVIPGDEGPGATQDMRAIECMKLPPRSANVYLQEAKTLHAPHQRALAAPGGAVSGR